MMQFASRIVPFAPNQDANRAIGTVNTYDPAKNPAYSIPTLHNIADGDPSCTIRHSRILVQLIPNEFDELGNRKTVRLLFLPCNDAARQELGRERPIDEPPVIQER